MRLLYRFIGLTFLILITSRCTDAPNADAVFEHLQPGEGQFIVRMNGELFYPADSRFKGKSVLTKESLRINAFDQYEGNTIITLAQPDLFAKKPYVQSVTLDQQITGNVMIGRLRDKVQRTGEGFLMTKGTVTVDHLSDDKLVIRFNGYVGNFNTMRDSTTWKRFDGLFVYKKPGLVVQDTDTKSLFY